MFGPKPPLPRRSSAPSPSTHAPMATMFEAGVDSSPSILVYLLRRDLRVSDNPLLLTLQEHGAARFTHLLPVYVFPAHQVEVSGFIPEGDAGPSPYPEARSAVGRFWRCGPHRATFLAEAVWDVKEGLEGLGSGLCVRVGSAKSVLEELMRGFEAGHPASVTVDGMIDQPVAEISPRIGAVWMTREAGDEEKMEEQQVQEICADAGIEYTAWTDEKYLVDDRDLPFTDLQELPDIFTSYRKLVEPLCEAPRPVLPAPTKGSLPPYPAWVPPQSRPFATPTTLAELKSALLKPLTAPLISSAPAFPAGTASVHPFQGGETHAHHRLEHLLSAGIMTGYHDTRNGLVGPDFSTKLSAYLALGCITSRQIHESLLALERGTNESWSSVAGFGKGENEGTKNVRFELLWRDYMRLCTMKFGTRLFHVYGFKQKSPPREWTRPAPISTSSDAPLDAAQTTLLRVLNGTTGMGLIDASQREIYLTGYTSNRARQNVASFLTKHLGLDWRLGAEWYESVLIDYDVSSNWGNWQYVAGVGNDPRGEARVFNPVKQASDYDPQGAYIKAWVPELRGLTEPQEIFQAWTTRGVDQRAAIRGYSPQGLDMLERPLKKIDFLVDRRTRGGNNGGGSRRGGTSQRGGDKAGPHHKSTTSPTGSGSGSGSGSGGGAESTHPHPRPGSRGHNHGNGRGRGGYNMSGHKSGSTKAYAHGGDAGHSQAGSSSSNNNNHSSHEGGGNRYIRYGGRGYGSSRGGVARGGNHSDLSAAPRYGGASGPGYGYIPGGMPPMSVSSTPGWRGGPAGVGSAGSGRHGAEGGGYGVGYGNVAGGGGG